MKPRVNRQTQASVKKHRKAVNRQARISTTASDNPGTGKSPSSGTQASNDANTIQIPGDPSGPLQQPGIDGNIEDRPQDPNQNHDEAGNGKAAEDKKARQEKLSLQLEQACNLWKQLVLFFEAQRLNLGDGLPTQFAEKQQAHLNRLCELAIEQGMRENPFLDELSGNWFSERQRLQTKQKRTKDQEEELRQCLEEISRTRDIFDNAVDQRTDTLVDIDPADIGPWPAPARVQNEAVSAAREDLEQALKEYKAIQEEINISKLAEQQIAELPNAMAKAALIKLSYLQSAQVSGSEDSENRS